MKTFLVATMTLLALVACTMAQPVPEKPEAEKRLTEKFASYYEPVAAIEITPTVPTTPLPLDLTKTANWEQAQGWLSEPARAVLAKNGFAVSDAFAHDRVEAFYKSVKDAGLPLFITSDSLLHLYHIQFDETLKGIEERQFIEHLAAFSKAMWLESAKELRASYEHGASELDKEAWRLCHYYFYVAATLSDPQQVIRNDFTPPPPVQAEGIGRYEGSR